MRQLMKLLVIMIISGTLAALVGKNMDWIYSIILGAMIGAFIFLEPKQMKKKMG